jgi:hypothetical protein
MDIKELKAQRLLVLSERNRSTDPEAIEACNVKLRKFNLAIQGVTPWEEEKKEIKINNRRRKKKDISA